MCPQRRLDRYRVFGRRLHAEHRASPRALLRDTSAWSGIMSCADMSLETIEEAMLHWG